MCDWRPLVQGSLLLLLSRSCISVDRQMMCSSQKFTGLATKIGADLALALKDDVTSMFSGIEGLTMDKVAFLLNQRANTWIHCFTS